MSITAMISTVVAPVVLCFNLSCVKKDSVRKCIQKLSSRPVLLPAKVQKSLSVFDLHLK